MSTNLQDIAVDQIIPSPQNRRHIDRKAPGWKEFVGSIKQRGILTPLIARRMPEHGGGHSPAELDELSSKALVERSQLLDLRAGHRRLAAAIELGLSSAPVIILDLSDQDAMILTISENKDRQDLTALEYAEQIAEARKVGLEDKTIAEKLGKTEAYVARRAKLLNLSPLWRGWAADPDNHVSRWPAAVLEVVARLTPATQDLIDVNDVFEELHLDERPITVTGFEKYVAANVLGTLGGAPFKLDDASLVPKAGACTTCPKRASQEAILFEELREGGGKGKEQAFKDRCLDRVCFENKTNALVDRRMAELEKEHGKVLPVIQNGTNYEEEKRITQRFKDAVQAWDYRYDVVSEQKSGAIPGVYVAGRAKGQTVWLKPRRSSASSTSDKAKKKPAGERVITPLKERRKTHDARRVALAVKKFEDWLDTPEAVGAFAKRGGALLAPLITVFGTTRNASYRGTTFESDAAGISGKGKGVDSWAAFQKVREVDQEIGLKCGAEQVLPVLRQRVKYFSLDDAAKAWDEAKRIGALIDHDMAAVLAAASDELPEPASWAREEAAGPKQKKTAKTAKHAKPKKKAKAAK